MSRLLIAAVAATASFAAASWLAGPVVGAITAAVVLCGYVLALSLCAAAAYADSFHTAAPTTLPAPTQEEVAA